MSDGFGDPEPAPAEFHGSPGHRVEGAAYIPAGRIERGPEFISMFPRIDELQQSRVRAPARPETMLGIGEYLVTFPGPGDALDNNAHPELAYDFKEYEGAESIQRDLHRRVLGFQKARTTS